MRDYKPCDNCKNDYRTCVHITDYIRNDKDIDDPDMIKRLKENESI